MVEYLLGERPMPSNPIPRYLPGSTSYAQVGTRLAALHACCLPGRPGGLHVCRKKKASTGLGPLSEATPAEPLPVLCPALLWRRLRSM